MTEIIIKIATPVNASKNVESLYNSYIAGGGNVKLYSQPVTATLAVFLKKLSMQLFYDPSNELLITYARLEKVKLWFFLTRKTKQEYLCQFY